MSDTKPGLPWKVRALQFDLARQMETVDYLCRYTDFAAAQGFNTLVLYLEGRVRTPSFPFRPAEQSYTLEEMARVVRHAGMAGMDVVPVIGTLGHAEQFVGCAELAHLAEQRDGHTRFGGVYPSTFCPSLPETYDFLERYLTEIAEVFTGPNLHIGCDEVWDLGFCHLCEKRRRRDELGDLFLEHLARIEAIGVKLGKRLWMWDDMYELFPEKLEQAPRAMVLCHWQYDPVIEPEGIQAHFLNRRRRNWLAEYARLGLPAIICPTTLKGNIDTFTDYGRHYPLLGGLLTQWGDSSVCLHTELTPLIAYTGRLWNETAYDPDRSWGAGVTAVLPQADAALRDTLRALTSIPRRFPSGRPQAYLRGPVPQVEHIEQDTARLALIALQRASADNPALAESDILGDLETMTRLNLLSYELRALLPQIYDPRRLDSDVPRLQRTATACRDELAALLTRLAPLHDRRRPGIDKTHSAVTRLTAARDGLEATWERLARPVRDDDWWLVLRLFLPDAHGAPHLRVSLIRDGEAQPVLDGTIKADSYLGECYYTIQVPFTSAQPPEAVRLEVWGHGGQGITYLEAQHRDRTLQPSQIRFVADEVQNAEAILRDDTQWAYFGYQNIDAAMRDHALATEHAMVEVELADRSFLDEDEQFRLDNGE